jgi:hypothetical protein
MSRSLIVVTHLLGAGHLTRSAALARAFMRGRHDVADRAVAMVEDLLQRSAR